MKDNKKVVEEILNFWRSNQVFEKSLTNNPQDRNFIFYDGPPFASGSPHYGHLLASSIKDVVPRFMSMKWWRVYRKWWWDCHWLPAENYVEKKLWISWKKDIEDKLGIQKFVEACRTAVMQVNDEWKRFVDHIWRWVDMENAYFTMDVDFMESVIWVFSSLYKNNLIYKAFKPQGYCPRCGTTLSNNEINEWYAPKQDPAITIKFPLDEQKSKFTEIVAGVVRDSQGRILMSYHGKENIFLLFGGKVEQGESLEQALKRELQEELWIEINWAQKLGAIKIVHRGKPYRVHYFQVQNWTGELQNKEPHLHKDLKRVEVVKDPDLPMGWGAKVDGLIIDDPSRLIREYVDLWLLQSWILEDEKAANAPFNLLAWTTTPWTLPSNMFLTVGEDILYSIIWDKADKQYYVLATAKIKEYYKNPEDFIEVYRLPWGELQGLAYQPLFDFYLKSPHIDSFYKDKVFRVLIWDFVSTEEGTWIVHMAPAFGQDDFNLVASLPDFGLRNTDKWLFNPIDDFGRFTQDVDLWAWKNVFEANKEIIGYLKQQGKLVKYQTIEHSYPHCRRCGTPLIYRAVPSRFVDEPALRGKLVDRAQDLYFVPESVKNRFLNLLRTAPEWNISRARYWGSPLPVWESSEYQADDEASIKARLKQRNISQDTLFDPKHWRIIIGSLDDLYRLDKFSGQKSLSRLVLLRHWKAQSNIDRVFDIKGSHLTEEGQKQAQQVISKIQGITADDINSGDFVIIISPLRRTFETVYPLLKEFFGSEADEMTKKYEEIAQKRERAIENKDLSIFAQSPIWLKEGKVLVDFRVAERWLFSVQGKTPSKWEEFVSEGEKGDESYQSFEGRIKQFLKDTIINFAGKSVIIVGHWAPLFLMQHILEGKGPIQNKLPYLDQVMLKNTQPYLIFGDKLKTQHFDAPQSVDLHRPYVDRYEFDIEGKKFKRIKDVLDCWFESGSMPYGQENYPHKYKRYQIPQDKFPFPADFIAEGLDQTRWWFHALHVISNGVMDANSFKNVVVNGLILAEDGKKMSKKLKNYPDPKWLLDRYGPDAFRLYVLGSPAVRAEPLRFSEKGVDQVLKSMVLPLSNVYNFLEMYAKADWWQNTSPKIWFMRHAQAEGTHQEAKILSEDIQKIQSGELDEVLLRIRPDVIIYSPWVRTTQTAQQIKQRLEQLGVHIKEFKPMEEMALEIPQQEVFAWYQNIVKNYPRQKILIISHKQVGSLLFSKLLDTNSSIALANLEVVWLPTQQLKNELDRWILSEFNLVLQKVEDYLSKYILDVPVKEIDSFIDKFTNWYLRRSRRRFWASGMDEDKKWAYWTLSYVFEGLLKMMAPYAPFITEKIWLDWQKTGLMRGEESIHLEGFPLTFAHYIDQKLMDEINLVRKIVKLGLYLRSKNKIKVKQPLQKLYIRLE